MNWLGNEIICRRCLKVISTNYNADRFHAETELYTHHCGLPHPDELEAKQAEKQREIAENSSK